jgi:hypothetical protein
VNPLIPLIPLDIANKANMVRLLDRTEPEKNNARDAYQPLTDAYEARVRQVAPDTEPADLNIQQYTPKNTQDSMQNLIRMAGNARNEGGGYNIMINPNVDRAIFAHELGHAVSDQTKVGRMARSLRSNPKLAAALGAAAMLVPGAVTALTPGDDDVAGATALAMAAASPTLIDEAFATKEGLKMMDMSNMRANLGQRGKLAGGFLTYAASPLIIGLGGSLTGNIFDEPSPTELTP